MNMARLTSLLSRMTFLVLGSLGLEQVITLDKRRLACCMIGFSMTKEFAEAVELGLRSRYVIVLNDPKGEGDLGGLGFVLVSGDTSSLL